MLTTWSAPWKGEPRAFLRSSGTVLAYFVGFGLGGLVFFALFNHVLKPLVPDASPWLKEWINLVSTGWMFGVALAAFLLARAKLSAPERRVSIWQATSGRPAWAWGLVSAAAWLIITMTATLVTDGLSEMGARAAAFGLMEWTVLLVTALACIGVQAASEEIVFRGYLMPRLAVRVGAVAALLISTVLFTALHTSPGLWGGLGVALMGLCMGVSAWRTGSLLPAIGLHVVNNVFYFLYEPNGTNADVTWIDFALLVVGLLVWLGWVEMSHRQRSARASSLSN